MILRLIFLCVVFSANVSNAQIKVLREHRVENINPGYCGWCALETEGRRLRIKALQGIVKYRKSKKLNNGITPENVVTFFEKRKLDYKLQKPGTKKVSFLKGAIDNGWSVVIGLDGWPMRNMGHAVLLTELTKKSVSFIDSNDVSKVTKKTRKWLTKYWDGFAFHVIPPER